MPIRINQVGQEIQTWFGRVEQDFQKRSGWRVQPTLSHFSRLKGLDKMLFGGLLLGKALLGDKTPPPRKRSAKKTKRTAH